MAAPFELPKLPYESEALAPVISAQTIGFHYGKHHQAYVTNLNNLVQGKPYAEMSLEDVIKKSATVDADKGIFNNAAQIWNHTFYWNSLTPKTIQPSARMMGMIEKSFGSWDGFVKEFTTAANTQFASGWAWLVRQGDGLAITKTGNADTPMTGANKPLLTIDVWEHAYYLDYQNRRADYTAALVGKMLNWDFAEKNWG